MLDACLMVHGSWLKAQALGSWPRGTGPAPELDCDRGLHHTGAAQQHRRKRAGLPTGAAAQAGAPPHTCGASGIAESRGPGAPMHRHAAGQAWISGCLRRGAASRPQGPKKQARRVGLCYFVHWHPWPSARQSSCSSSTRQRSRCESQALAGGSPPSRPPRPVPAPH